MTLNPIIALDHVIEEYRDHLQSEFRAHDRTMRQALETELDRPLSLAQPVIDLPMGGRGGEWARRRMGEAANGRDGERYRQLNSPNSSMSKPPPPRPAAARCSRSCLSIRQNIPAGDAQAVEDETELLRMHFQLPTVRFGV